MSDGKGLLTRLMVKLIPQLSEDWEGAPGSRFRQALQRVSGYFEQHHIADKLEHVHDLGWKAVDGAASSQHAKAEADYARAENDRIEADLKRRTLEAKTRHECADADKAEAEAGLAKTREIQGRLELFKSLREIGVSVTLNASLELAVVPAKITASLQGEDVLDQNESLAIAKQSIYIRCPKVSYGIDAPSDEELIHVTRIEWLVSVGSRVKEGEQIGIMEIPSSPPSAHRILSHGTGVITQLVVVSETSVMSMAHVIATILPDQ